MAALLDDGSVLHDQNQVGIDNGREAVSDDKAGTAFHQSFHGLPDFHLCPGVYAGSSLVQYKNWRIAEKDSRYSQQSALACVERVYQLLDEEEISPEPEKPEVVEKARADCMEFII